MKPALAAVDRHAEETASIEFLMPGSSSTRCARWAFSRSFVRHDAGVLWYLGGRLPYAVCCAAFPLSWLVVQPWPGHGV